MKVLAIETSCDETGIAVVEGEKIPDGFSFTTLKAALLSQAHLHAPYGGVYPNLAKREHQKNLPLLFKEFEHQKVCLHMVDGDERLLPFLCEFLCKSDALPERGF